MRHNIRSDLDRGRYIDSIWQAVTRSLLTWPQAQEAQSAAMPTCDCCHTRPSIVKSERSAAYICADCYTAGQR